MSNTLAGAPRGASPLLHLEKITLAYDGAPILHNCSLTLEEGELVCLLGPSGCGKTTLLKVAGSFLLPRSGEVLLQGRPVTAPDPQRIMVFQDQDQLFPWKRVEDNVILGITRGRPTPAEREAARAILTEVGLGEALRRYPHQLSGGMRQRAALARAFAGRPRLFLMDEPFASVDAPQRRELQGLLQRLLRDHRGTALFVTHDVEEALLLGSRVLVMNRRGELLPEDPRRDRDRLNQALQEG
ncbi:NitT/TauT family transport system ATP-binding protein [Alkalispirochaeta americana]|uniref:NitT/TauT family transport system ATP-binding protein n=1 Tax=Alkalispirochaeta americana TaxID=159291 RepID=A0A1N6RWI2_9SPIO|nr:ATP-binding cassette domain-containing protein [Alkalispirochaeta americana]SIQ33224.1 NitT/TauT family transport system ATP-binding protein [Alkalispirochaeta americana]